MKNATLWSGRAGGLVRLIRVVFALLIVGCAGESEPVVGATLPADGPKAPTSGPPPADGEGVAKPRFDQPTRPDLTFVQRVADEFDTVANTAVRHLAQSGVVDQGFIDYQRAIYAPEWLQRSLEGWRVEKDALKPRPGEARTTVGEVVTWKEGCIVAGVRTDYSVWFAIQQPPLPKRYIALVPRPEQAAKDANPTGWWMTYDGWQDNGLPPDGLCGG